jgi:hypothetical protein
MTKLFQYLKTILTIGFLMAQMNDLLSQTNNHAQSGAANVNWSKLPAKDMVSALKTIDPSQIPTNAWAVILEKADWSKVPTNVQEYFCDEVDWSSIPEKVWAKYIHPGKWPDGPGKQKTLSHCAELLRSSVDTNQLDLILNKLLTNQPAVYEVATGMNKDGSKAVTLISSNDVIRFYQDTTKQLFSTLDRFASYMTNSKLETYTADFGYAAKISAANEVETKYISFYSENGPIMDFRGVEIDGSGSRTAGGARFNKQGKLIVFDSRVYPILNSHIATRDVSVGFDENNRLCIDGILQDEIGVSVRLDASEKLRVKIDHFTRPKK